MKTVVATGSGGIEVLNFQDAPDPKSEKEQVLVRLEAIGVNFADIYARRGATAGEKTPMGREGAGVVEEVGAEVTEFKKGDKVAFSDTLGAYSELISVPAKRLVPIPEGITTKQAAAVLLQGMTAHYLATSTYPLKNSDTCLVHAAAGGVGELLVQIAKMRGAKVFGTVSTDEKAKVAKVAGVDEIILYTKEDFAEKVKELTNNIGVNVIYDSVGKDTILKDFDAVINRGMIVMFGQSSGAVDPIDTNMLVQKGSLTFARVSLKDYTAKREELLSRANEVFDWVISRKLKIRIFKEFPLAEVSEAQKLLENRETVGKVLLIP